MLSDNVMVRVLRRGLLILATFLAIFFFVIFLISFIDLCLFRTTGKEVAIGKLIMGFSFILATFFCIILVLVYVTKRRGKK